MGSLIQIVLLLLDVLWYFILAQIIMSWLINFGVLNTRQQLVIQIWHSLNSILEPIYRPIRKFLPATSGLDLAPLVVIIGLSVIRIIILNNAMYFV